MRAAELIAFEREVAAAFDAGQIHGPVHLNSDTQAEPLIEIFKDIKPTDWVLGTWRSHFHALLKGVPRDQVMAEILAGRSMMLHFPEYRFMSSAIMGGMLPIACGLAAGGERVWCFTGDMAATTGVFHDASSYACLQDLPVTFVVEDNGLATNSPTSVCWGEAFHGWFENSVAVTLSDKIIRYDYKRTTQHYQPLPTQDGF